jgi:hypothetical protein
VEDLVLPLVLDEDVADVESIGITPHDDEKEDGEGGRSLDVDGVSCLLSLV